MAFKDTIKDPLNWVLLILALAFGYYVLAIPYWTNYYLKTPQQMSLAEYLANPTHPRPFMLHALGSPPSSIEVVVTGLRVAHIDSDSILLESTEPLGEEPPTPAPATEPEPEAPAEAPEEPAAAQEEEDGPPTLGPEMPPPNHEILLPGDNMDLLEVTVGQEVAIQVHGLHQTPLGWVPQEPDLARETEEFFTKEELDELDRLKILANGNVIRIPYVSAGELRFAGSVHEAEEATTLEELANDTRYIQTANRLAGGVVEVQGVRLVGRGVQQLNPYFIVEDEAGRRAHAFYNARLLSEWYWSLDRLRGRPVLLRGVLRSLSPPELRQLEAEGNIQAVLEGYAILSTDGRVVINLEHPGGSPFGFGETDTQPSSEP